jgi:hypothetical protein
MGFTNVRGKDKDKEIKRHTLPVLFLFLTGRKLAAAAAAK